MDARPVMPAWAALLGCLGLVALITLVVGGPAVGFFARWVQYLLAGVTVITLIAAAFGWWASRREGHTFIPEDDEPAAP